MITADDVFEISGKKQFEKTALKIFRYQFEANHVYRQYCTHLQKSPAVVKNLSDIPFLPISFFKSHRVICENKTPEVIFTSSGTTGAQTSRHEVSDASIYIQSFRQTFATFYGNVSDYVILALLPSYLERGGSSLVYMVSDLIDQSANPNSGFYLNDLEALADALQNLHATENILLIGVSYALLDLVEKRRFNLKNAIVMETGGMKGRRRELIREELHAVLKSGFGTTAIHSEYGMTELLSQAYSTGNGRFHTPAWMKVLTRDPEDPLTLNGPEKNGGLNIIDLANLNSCAFIATQDLGKVYRDGSFEVLGRFDNADIRGCNLMVL